MQAKGALIFGKILAVASGEPTKSEELDHGQNEFTPWQLGAVLWKAQWERFDPHRVT